MAVRLPSAPRRRVTLAACAVAGVAIAAPPAAEAGSVGRWEAIAADHATTVYQPGLVRTGAGGLHAAYVVQRSDGALDLFERAITASGAVGAQRPVLAGYATLGDPALLGVPGGLRVLVGGQRSTATDDPIHGLLTATAPAGAGAWSEPAVTTPQDGETGFASGDVAALSPAGDGVPLALSSGTGFGVVAHRSVDPAAPVFNLQDGFGACCIGQAQLVLDQTTATPTAVYQSVITGRDGVFVQPLDPGSGAPVSAPVALRGLGAAGVAPAIDPVLARTAAGARVGGGVYVAVPSGLALPDRTRLWRAGGGPATTLGSGRGRHYSAAVIPTPDGRVWVAWSEERTPGGLRIVLRRSNRVVSSFGERVTLTAPAGAVRAFALDGSSQALRLDLVATASTASGSRPFHTQALPPLELRASPSRIRGGRTASVRFTVTDVGVAVAGATVRSGAQQVKTAADGSATLRLGGPRRGGKITATATKPDYRTDKVSVTATRAVTSPKR